MASIVERNKSYAVVYLIKNERGEKKQKWETYHSKKEAEKRKFEIDNAVPFLGVIPKLSTVSDLINEYINLYGKRKWSFSTYSTNISLINRYILPQIGKASLACIDNRLMSRYYQMLSETPIHEMKYKPKVTGNISDSTIYYVHKLLRSVFNQAVKWGCYRENPVKYVSVPKPNYTIRDILSIEQLILVIKTASIENPVLSLAVQLAFSCSLRKGELLALCWEDIDFGEGCIYIKKELIRIQKNALEALSTKSIIHIFPALYPSCKTRLVLKTPKTKASVRKVYLPKILLNKLAVWQNTQQQQHTNDEGYEGYKFILTYENGKPLSAEWITEHFHQLLEKLCLPNVVFHSLRHTSTTYKLLISGGDIKSVQGDNGHVKPDMVLNVYARIQDEQRKMMAEQIDSSFYSKL